MTLLNERKPNYTRSRLIFFFFFFSKAPLGGIAHRRISALAPPLDVSMINMLIPMDAG